MNSEQFKRVNSREQAPTSLAEAKLRYNHLPLLFAICYLLFAVFSCGKGHDASRRRPSAIIELAQADREIAKIAENARRGLPNFFRSLSRPEKGANNFCVKYPLTAIDGSVEYAWLNGINFKNGVYYGVIANTTMLTDSVNKGDTIIIDTDKITDWMYVQDGKIMGGRSIKYLLEKIPETQRSEEQRKILLMFD